jgi:hypothetical protein
LTNKIIIFSSLSLARRQLATLEVVNLAAFYALKRIFKVIDKLVAHPAWCAVLAAPNVLFILCLVNVFAVLFLFTWIALDAT